MDPKPEIEQKPEAAFETKYCRTCDRDTDHVRVDASISPTGHNEFYCLECLARVEES